MTDTVMSRKAARHTRPRHLVRLDVPPSGWRVAGLALLNLVFPGAPRFLRLGGALRWVFLLVPALFWAASGFVLLQLLTDRAAALSLVTNPTRSLVVIIGLLALALWYLLTYLDLFGVLRFRSQRPRLKTLTATILVPFLLLAPAGTGFAAYLVNAGRNAITTIFTPTQPDGSSATTPFLEPVNGRYNFLIMGGDAGSDRVGRRPDSIMAVSIDAQSGQTAVISIPRNLQNAQFPDDSPMRSVYPEGYNCGDQCIINSLYTEVTQNYQSLYPQAKDPGAEAMMDAASGTLGLTMQAYVIVDMENFSKLIDLLGGVEITAGGWVPMSGAALDNYGNHLPPVGWIAPGNQRLNGEEALWYARSREWTNDYARSQRQQCVVQALIKQADPLTVLTQFSQLAEAGAQIMESSISTEQLGTFLDLAVKAQGQDVTRLTLGPPDFPTQFPTYPDFSAIQSEVNSLLTTGERLAESDSSASAGSPQGEASGNPTGAPTNNPDSGNPPQETSTPGPESGNTSPSNGPEITREYLQSLAVAGNSGALVSLLANNGNCTPG